MKTIAALSSFLLKSIVVFGLVVAAGLAGVGIAALFAFHTRGGFVLAQSSGAQAQAELMTPPRLVALSRINRWQGEKIMMNVGASMAANRFVAAESWDKPQFTYADYQEDETGAPMASVPKHSRLTTATTIIPPPLIPLEAEVPNPVAVPNSQRPLAPLSDPGSHYIIDKDTGRVVGIDGTAGAMADEQQEQQRQQAAVVARPAREVRTALPVEAVVVSDLPPPKPNAYPAIRRAVPVDDTDTQSVDATAAQPFNAAAEVADDERPVLRAIPLTTNRPTRPQPRLFTFP